MSIRQTWGRYAANFASEEADVQNRPPMQRLIELMDLPAGAHVLDVATGAGFTAFAFAARGCRVIASDPTHEMLLAARAGWTKRGLPGEATLVETWAEALPFADGTFDAVVSHRAPHQFADRPAFLREARRIVKPGGLVGIADQSPIDGFEDWHNDLERLRDPTHEEALSVAQWRALFEDAGLTVVASENVGQPHDAEGWIARVHCTPEQREAILHALRTMPEPVRAFCRPEEREDGLWFLGAQGVVVASVP